MLRVNLNGTKSWYVQLNRTQKRKIGDAGMMTAAVARYRARDFLASNSAADYSRQPLARSIKLSQFLLGRYANWKSSQSRWAQRDIHRLCSALGELGDLMINEIGLSHVERWKMKRTLRVKRTTANRELATLRAALTKAVEWGMLDRNPALRVKQSSTEDKQVTRVLNDRERNRLRYALNARCDHIRPLVYLALNTGLKRGEIFGLQWRDVILGPAPSLLIKTSFRNTGTATRAVSAGIQRRVPLNLEAAGELKRWQKQRDRWGPLVFRNSSGGRLRSIKTGWAALMNEAQIRGFRFKDCRHDFAAQLVMAGAPLSHVRDLLGHSSIILTERYAQFSPGTLKQSVALLDRQVAGRAER
jgi:integrase